MEPCPKSPLIYEINTWVWLADSGEGHRSELPRGLTRPSRQAL